MSHKEEDNRLRELLDGAHPDELGCEFDKAALWNRIEPRTRSRQTIVRVLRPWWSHAVAVAAGLLIAWIFLPRTVEKGEKVEAVIAGRRGSMTSTKPESPAPAAEVVKREREDDGDKTQTAEASVVPNKRLDVGSPVTPALLSESLGVIGSDERKDNPIPDAPPNEERPSYENSTVRQPAPVVVHLLDVADADGHPLRQPVELVPTRRLGFFARMLYRNKVPDLTGAASADATAQRTYFSR